MQNLSMIELSRRILFVGLLAVTAMVAPERSPYGADKIVGPPALAVVARQLGLEPLQTASVPSTGWELRIWVDYGSPAGSYLLQLQNLPSAVAGRVVAWTWDGNAVRARPLGQQQDWAKIARELQGRSVWEVAARDGIRTLCISDRIPLLVESVREGTYRRSQHDVVGRDVAEMVAAEHPEEAKIVQQAASVVEFVRELASRTGLVAEQLPRPHHGCG